VTDLLANLPAPAKAPADSSAKWTEADALAARRRLRVLVDQVLARMPPRPASAPVAERVPEPVTEGDAFAQAVATLVASDR
jgi:hypothetical protein